MGKCRPSLLHFVFLLALACVLAASDAMAQRSTDWVSGMSREALPVKAWPDGRKVAVCFVFYVEEWGHGMGPNFRSDMNGRDPDVVDESFRQYAIEWAVPRVGRLFKEEGVPLSIALNALFPQQHAEVWKAFRASVPNAPIIAHGINNSNALLPLSGGLDAQRAYIRRTLDMIQQSTGVRPRGWSSPSVYPNADTFRATLAEGIGYSLDGMDSDVLSALVDGGQRMTLVPYPPVTVDMGQYLARFKEPVELEHLWIDYVTELAAEAAADPDRDATVVAIGIHPFVVGTPVGAAAMRRVLDNLKQQKLVWLADPEMVLRAAGIKF